MNHFAVINPCSFLAKDSMEKVLADFEECFSESGEDYKIHVSRYPRDAVATVSRYIESVPAEKTVRVYAVGGDGILFDCLNGMVKYKNAELTSVPFSKANDVVRAFGENAAPFFRDIKTLMNAPALPMDIISYGTNYALNEANIGVIGLSMLHSNSILRNPSIKWTRHITPQIYTVAGLIALTNKDVRHQEYTILIDGEDISGRYSNIHIANGPCNGGSLLPSPYAVPNDGFLDVIFCRESSFFIYSTKFPNYTKGHFEKNEKLFFRRRCRVLEISSDKPLCVELDGESFYAQDVRIELISGGIKFFAPEGLNFADYSHRAYKGGKGGDSR